MRVLILMLATLLPTPMLAQGSCSTGSMAWAPASAEDCRSRGGVYSDSFGRIFTIPSESVTGSAIGAGGTSTSAAPSPTCELDWTLVLDRGGSPMCAQVLKPATR